MDYLNLTFGVVSIISFGATIYYGKKSSKLEKERKKLDWADLQSCANDLGKDLKKTKFKPDIIFTPGLRGATFANLLQNEISGEIPVFVGISFWKEKIKNINSFENYEMIETSKWFILIPKLIMSQKNKKILIVDDYAMSGDFLQNVIKLVTNEGINKKNVKSMTIATTKVAIENHKEPDYYWMTTHDSNFYFPWGKAK
jgi:hypoxanthine phosphoribosyltransferase